MRRIAALSAVLLAGLSCRSTTAPKPPQAAASHKGAPIAPGASKVRSAPDIETLVESGSFRFEAPARYTSVVRHRFRVLTKDARERWGVISIGWEPAWQKRPAIEATVTQPGGGTVALDPSLVTEQQNNTDGMQVSSEHRLVATLPSLQVGSVVDMTVTIQHDRASLYEGVGFTWLWGSTGHDIRVSTLTLDLPEGMPLRFVNHGPAVVPRETRSAGRRVLAFEARDLERLPGLEDFLPDSAVRVPLVAITTASSWDALAARYWSQVGPELEGAACSSDLAALVPAPGPMDQRLAQLLDRVRARVRYTGLELGEAAFVPRSPCEVLRRGFGDCKDQSALLRAVLARMGVKADLALLRTGPGWDVPESLPSLSFFDHAVVYVPGADPLWIDPTLDFGRAGELGSSSRGRLSLVLDGGKALVTRTPAGRASENTLATRRRIVLSSFGKGRVIEDDRRSGAIERWDRGAADSLTEEDARRKLSEYAESAFRAARLTEGRRTPPHDLSQAFSYHIEAEEVGIAQTDLYQAVAGVNPNDLFTYLPELFYTAKSRDDHEQRRHPWALHVPHRVTMEIRVVAPEGFAFVEAPDPTSIAIGGFSATAGFEAESPTEVVGRFTLEAGSAPLSPAEMDALREKLSTWRASFPLLVRFQNDALAKMKAGKEVEGFAELRSLVQAHPGEPIYHVWYALGLLQAGFGAEAREASDRAAELAPDNADVAALHAYVLQHNDLGLPFGSGYHRKELLAAIDKAVALAPERAAFRFDHAIYLEHDADGQRYAPGADLKRAAEEYRRAIDLGEKAGDATVDDARGNLAFVLFHLGSYADVLETLDKAASAVATRGVRAATLAVSRGIEAAAHEIESAGESDGPTVRQTAVQLLISVGAYSEAAGLLRRLANGASGFDLQLQATRLGSVQSAADVIEKAEEPGKTALRLMAAILGDQRIDMDDILAADVRQYFTKNELESAAGQGLSAALGRASGGAGMSLGTIRDVGLSAMALQVDGDRRLGYRVVLTPQFGAADGSVSVFVSGERGGRKIIGMSGALGFVGAQAVKRLDQGDIRSAKQLLEWATPGGPPVLARIAELTGIPEERRLRLQAAALMASQTEISARGTDALVKALEREKDGKTRKVLVPYLAMAFQLFQRRPHEALGWLERMRAQGPLDDDTLRPYLYLLVVDGQGQRARELMQERVAKGDAPDWATEFEASAAEYEGHYGEAVDLWEKNLSVHDNARAHNSIAWVGLLAGTPMAELLRHAVRANEMTSYTSEAYLHTLATVYAYAGKLNEARQIFLRLMTVRGQAKLGPQDGIIIGRMAEQYGLDDVAVRYYRGIEPDDTSGRASTKHLAVPRLAELGAPAPVEKAGR